MPNPDIMSVLFACTYNAVRSPIAKALLKRHAQRRLFIDSVGVRIKDEMMNPFVLEVMKEVGIDLTGHRCQNFNMLHDTYFDLVISLSPEAHHWAIEIVRTTAWEVMYWPTLDPTILEEKNRETILQAYRDIREELNTRIINYFQFL